MSDASVSATLKVLVAVDFSEASRRALAWAYDYATRAPCELHVLHVTTGHPSIARLHEELHELAEDVELEARRMLPDRAERMSVGQVVQHIAVGPAAERILAFADELDAETIVMGTHGRPALAALVMGSVATKVVRLAHCPVVCVKPGRAAMAAAPGTSKPKPTRRAASTSTRKAVQP